MPYRSIRPLLYREWALTNIYTYVFIYMYNDISHWQPYICSYNIIQCTRAPWWRHQMETFSALLVLCAGNSPVTGEFPTQRLVTQSFDVFFYLCLNKWLSKQLWGWWFETPWCSLWHHCYADTKLYTCIQLVMTTMVSVMLSCCLDKKSMNPCPGILDCLTVPLYNTNGRQFACFCGCASDHLWFLRNSWNSHWSHDHTMHCSSHQNHCNCSNYLVYIQTTPITQGKAFP